MRELALKSERVHIGLLFLKPEDAARFPECFVECTQSPKKKTSLARQTKKSVPRRMLVDLIAEAPQPRGQLGLRSKLVRMTPVRFWTAQGHPVDIWSTQGDPIDT